MIVSIVVVLPEARLCGRDGETAPARLCGRNGETVPARDRRSRVRCNERISAAFA